MGLRKSFISLLISVFVMAVSWEIMDRGFFPTHDFSGKIIISLGLVLISGFLSKVLGGK